MKGLSFFLLKNSLGSKMRKGIRNFCNGDGSTSTLNQHKPNDHDHDHVLVDDHHDHLMNTSPYYNNYKHRTSTTTSETPPTLEEMILQLELEEEFARKAKLKHDNLVTTRGGRMSCVNNSDILRSARNALNQYPRFSLDGKDAMYRSSFRNFEQVAARKSVCCERGLLRSHQEKYLPATLAGESVVWCKPGVIAKLMGLEAMPMPINRQRNSSSQESLRSIVKRQNLRRRVERHEMERRVAGGCSSDHDHMNNLCKRGKILGSSSCPRNSNRYCVMKPVAVEPPNDEGGWPTRQFR